MQMQWIATKISCILQVFSINKFVTLSDIFQFPIDPNYT